MQSPCPRRRVLVLAGVALALGGIVACSRSGPDVAGTATTLAPPALSTAAAARPPLSRPDPASLPALSPDLPLDLPFEDTAPSAPNLTDSRHALDALSWRTFIALNWPALPDGSADRAQVPGRHGDNPSLWENWSEFPAPASPPAALRDSAPGLRVLPRVLDASDPLAHADHPFDTGPLIDQNGRYARFESLVNRPLLDALLAHRLHGPPAGADAHAGLPPCAPPADPATGAVPVQVRATWKILSPAEAAAGRFHAVEALLPAPASAIPGVEARFERVTVGLIGLHITRKIASSPGWVWSAFEHVDNYPTAGEPADRAAYNFYDKTAPATPPNVLPPRPWTPSATEPPSRRPQLVRPIRVSASTRALNAAYQAALRAVNPASVWQYYELVGTRRADAPAPGCDAATLAGAFPGPVPAATSAPGARP